MAVGTHSSGKRTYFTVGFGKLRQKRLENGQKVTKDTPGATERKTSSGGLTYAIEYDFIEGIIEKIYFKEDREYGNSYEVQISDGPELFQVSFPQESRFWFRFMDKLPNVDLSERVKITVYDFIDKDNKKRTGTSLEQNGKKIDSKYIEFKEGKPIYHYNYPEPIGVDFHDRDDLTTYLIKVKKFLHSQFEAYSKKYFTEDNNRPVETPPEPIEPDIIDDVVMDSDEMDDLPF